VRRVSQWTTIGLGGQSSLGAGVGGGPVTGTDKGLEEGWGTASACSCSRGDNAREGLTAWGGSGLLRAGEQGREGVGRCRMEVKGGGGVQASARRRAGNWGAGSQADNGTMEAGVVGWQAR
jgi:hypothetical protein